MITVREEKATPSHFDGMGSYWTHLGHHLPPSPFHPDADQLRAVERMTDDERESVRVHVSAPEEVPVAFGTATEATLRIALLRRSRDVDFLDGTDIAEHLQFVFFSRSGRWPRRAIEGWALLVELDRLALVNATLKLRPAVKEDQILHCRLFAFCETTVP